jgi:hypothetical protein
MKKTVLLFGFFALFSCSITEKLVVLPDDQVKISHEINLSELLVMAKSMGGNESNEISMQKKQDTIISFKSVFDAKRDSISLLPLENQNQLKILEKYRLKMLINDEEDQFIMTLFADFDNTKELLHAMDIGEVLEKSNINPAGGKDFPEGLMQTPGKTTYSFVDNAFKRQTTFEKKKNSTISQEPFDPENPKPEEMLEMVKDMPIAMTYKIAYRFSKRIRATNVKTAKISADRLNVDFEFDMKTYETDPEYLNLEIYFE